jgi:hypothetical protein
MKTRIKTNHASIERFADFVQLKDYRERTREEYVRYVRRLADIHGGKGDSPRLHVRNGKGGKD